VAILGERSVTLTTYAAGAVGADGRWADGAATTSTIKASIQPPSDRQLERLPEGLRQRVTRIAYTTSECLTADQDAGTSPDRITDGSEVYQVVNVAEWPTAGPLPHYEVALQKFAETGGEP